MLLSHWMLWMNYVLSYSYLNVFIFPFYEKWWMYVVKTDIRLCSGCIEGCGRDWMSTKVWHKFDLHLLDNLIFFSHHHFVNLFLMCLSIFDLFRDNPPKQVISISPSYNYGLHRPPQHYVDPSSGYLCL